MTFQREMNVIASDRLPVPVCHPVCAISLLPYSNTLVDKCLISPSLFLFVMSLRAVEPLVFFRFILRRPTQILAMTFVNTSAIAYRQNHEAPINFLPVCNSSCVVSCVCE